MRLDTDILDSIDIDEIVTTVLANNDVDEYIEDDDTLAEMIKSEFDEIVRIKVDGAKNYLREQMDYIIGVLRENAED